VTSTSDSAIPSIDTRETRTLASEVKFLVDPITAHRIRDWARLRLSPDPYAGGGSRDEYRTTSLYFDTQDLDVFHRRGSFGRAKYRVRRYGDAQVVFLERKLRTSALLAKWRTSIALDELPRVSEPSGEDWVGRWFRNRLAARKLTPTCQVSYERTARIGQGDSGPIRLTLDRNLRVVLSTGLEFRAARSQAVLDYRLILELKFSGALPSLFKELIEQFRLTPQAVSKYRLGLRTLSAAEHAPITTEPRPAAVQFQMACA
jgi:VTC domain